MARPLQTHFRLVLLNCENLFVHLELRQNQDLGHITEREWQGLTQSTVGNKPLGKVRWLAQTIRDLNPDVLALCEVGGIESLDNFNRHFLRDHYQPYLIEGNSDRGIDVGYLVRRDRQEKSLLISHRRRPLNFTYPSERSLQDGGVSRLFSRDCAELRLFRPNERSPAVVFLLVHLKSKLDPDGIDPRGYLRREAEARALVEIYNEIRKETLGTPVIVTGDFNAQGRYEVCEPELRSIHEKTDLNEVMDLINRQPDLAASQITFPRGSLPQKVQIDHVFISPELNAKVVAAETGIVNFKSDLEVPIPYVTSLEQRQALPSDHYPVQVTFLDFLRPS